MFLCIGLLFFMHFIIAIYPVYALVPNQYIRYKMHEKNEFNALNFHLFQFPRKHMLRASAVWRQLKKYAFSTPFRYRFAPVSQVLRNTRKAQIIPTK